MNRNELDKKILAAITTLKSEGKSLTAINIQEITRLRLYQIYNSKHKALLEVRGKKTTVPVDTITLSAEGQEKLAQLLQNPPEPTETMKELRSLPALQEAAAPQSKTVDINLHYKLFANTLTIELKEATPDSIDDAIEDLTFLFKKSIARLQREKYNLY